MSVLGDLRVVAVHRDFRKLFAVRLVSQCGDGAFQVGLAALFFFSPERLLTAVDIAAAFAVLLLPFSLVGPFAGPLLDRWRRRQVLFFGNGVRLLLGLTLALLVATIGIGPIVYVLALVTLGINRFLLAALSAALPRVVPRDQLLMANAITPTLGAASAVAGAALGFAAALILPAGRLRDAVVLVGAALLFAAAAALALRLRRDQLGPETSSADLWGDLHATFRDLADGVRYLVRRRTPALGLGVMAVHRLLYGANFVALILISRNLLSPPADLDAGLAMFGFLIGISFAGNGSAVVLTPIAHQRMAPSTWIVVCLGIGVASQLTIAASRSLPLIATAAALLGLSVQGAKIAVDTIVQRDTHDDYRGRAFALYDMLYNLAFVGAATLVAVANTAGWLPNTGWSRPLFVGLAVTYVLTALAYRSGTTRVAAHLPPAR